ncbi:unnamed protein product, partial [Scytosiphon promiscuus]
KGKGRFTEPILLSYPPGVSLRTTCSGVASSRTTGSGRDRKTRDSMKGCGVFWTVCAVSGVASVSQAFVQPSSIVSSATRRGYSARGRDTGSPAAATAVPCRMSASSSSSGGGNSDDGDGDRRPALSNPFLAAAVGMALLSSDPAVTLAAQATRDAVFPGSAAASPTLLLSATEKKA